jgi:hypothetical protein
MSIELVCHYCPCRFDAAGQAPEEEIIRQMIEDGPWFALAAGPTFEDMVSTALTRRGKILCPECGEPVRVRESPFGDIACAPLAVG